jgi:hypothetical protein
MTFAINASPESFKKFQEAAAKKVKNIAPYGEPVGVYAGLEERFIEAKYNGTTY